MIQAAERRLSYDKNLLREAEAVMQEQFQERPNRSGFASSSQPCLAHPPQLPTFNDQVQFSEKATPSDSGLPFWRTTRGIALIVLIVLVIIGVVVGAAVGTTVSKNKAQSLTSNTIIGSRTSNPITGSQTPNPILETESITSSNSRSTGGTKPATSVSNVIAAMKQMGQYSLQDAYQASNNLDTSWRTP